MLAIVMIASVGLVGCGGDTEEGTGEGGTPAAEPQELHFMLSAEPPSLDPHLSTDQESFKVLNAVQEGLVRVGPNGIEPGMAESWEESEDGTKYVFKIREDAVWSNGDPLTAQDFVDGWERAINAKNASQYFFMITDYVVGAVDYYNYTRYEVLTEMYNTNLDAYKEAYTAEDGTVPTPDVVAFGAPTENPQPVTLDSVGFKAVDEHTLEVQLIQSTPWWLETTGFSTYLPLNKKFYEEHKDTYATEKDALLYNGPWIIEDWVHESKLVLKKNDQYWDKDTVKLDTITLDIVKDQSTALDLYESGAVDRTTLGRENVPLYKDDPNYGQFADMSHFYLVFNTTKKPFNNKKVREAISIAFDRQGYVDTTLNDGSVPATGLVPYDFSAYSGSTTTFREASEAKYGTLFTDNRAEEAKALLEEGLAEEGMTLDEFSFEFLSGDTEGARKSSEYLKSVWEATFGVEVSIPGVPFAERLKRSRNQEFDIVLSGWGPDYNDPYTWLFLFETDGPYNDGKWSNAKYDELVRSTKTETDQEKRLASFLEAEKILVEDYAISPVYFRTNSFVQKPYIKDLYTKAFGSEWEFKWTYIEGK